jgi:heme exporter protein D
VTDLLADFLAMGGYGAYVWPAYATVAVVMIGLLVASVRQLRRTKAQLAELRPELADGRR